MRRTLRRRLRLILLRAFARLIPPPASSELPSAPRILVLRPDHLGDLLFTTPALRALRQRYPDAHVTVLVGPWGAPVLLNNPQIDQLLTLPFPGFARRPKSSLWQPYGVLLRWARRLRGRYDLAFILRFDHWWGALLTFLARIPHRVGYDRPQVAPFLSHARPYRPGRHEVEQNLRLVGRDAQDKARHPLTCSIPEQARAWAATTFPERPIVAIHPGAGAPVKLWRTEGWAKVADALADEFSGRTPQLVLTGSSGERALCSEIVEQMETQAQVLAGETTLDQLAALFSRCRLVLGPDSGPLHLAVAVGTPTVHLYGPVDPATFGPWGVPERHPVVASAWPCIPCNRLDYGPQALAHHPCVREIRTQEVLTAARQLLRETERG